MKESNKFPKEHLLICNTCGGEIDMRDLGQVLQHGNIIDGNEICYNNKEEITYSSSQKLGEPILHTKSGEQIFLN